MKQTVYLVAGAGRECERMPVDLLPLRGGDCLWWSGYDSGRAAGRDEAIEAARESLNRGIAASGEWARAIADEWEAAGRERAEEGL